MKTSSISVLLIFVVGFTAITSLMIGYDLCIVSSVLQPISAEFQLCSPTPTPKSNLDCFQKAFFVSTLSPGAAIGSVGAGIFSDVFGRRRGLMLGDFLIAIGSICFAFGQTYNILLMGRFIIGVGIGVGFVVFAIYIPEVAPADSRGSLVAAQDCALSIGCLLSYAVVAAVPVHYWRSLLGSVGIVAGIQFAGCFLLPESPRWLIRRSRSDAAVASVMRLLPKKKRTISTDENSLTLERGSTTELTAKEEAEEAVRKMVYEYEEEKRSRQNTYGQETKILATAENIIVVSRDKEDSLSVEEMPLKKESLWCRFYYSASECWKYKGRLSIAVGCAVAQNFTVSNSVLYFSTDILDEAGVKNKLLAGVGIGFVKFLGVLSAILLVERLGRRILLLWGSITTCFCLFLFSLFFLLQSKGMGVASTLAIPLMLIYIYGWNISWAGLMFVVASEVLPSTIRGIGMGLTITVFWLMSFLFQSTLEATMAMLTMQGAFFLFGCLNIFTILFVVFFIQDLTGIALEDIGSVLKDPVAYTNMVQKETIG